MRSQLDCHDPRLPGTGVFDIKTRACHPLRHDRANVQQGSGHDVYLERGMGNTFERELYDLVRSAMLKFRYVLAFISDREKHPQSCYPGKAKSAAITGDGMEARGGEASRDPIAAQALGA